MIIDKSIVTEFRKEKTNQLIGFQHGAAPIRIIGHLPGLNYET